MRGILFRKETVNLRNGKCYSCKRAGHKGSQYRTILRRSNVKNPRMLSAETKVDSQIRKLVYVKVNGMYCNLQLDTGCDILIIITEENMETYVVKSSEICS